MIRDRSIAVTGGAGYIGSHACHMLATVGADPLVIDNLSTGSFLALNWGAFVEIDLRQTDLLTEALQRYAVDTVFHFAASAYVGESMAQPLKYHDNNVGGMLSLLSACAQAGVQKFIFSSSCATYGIPSQVPIGEAAPQRPINPYGRTKLICEQMLKDVAAQCGMDYAILRYFNVAGADPCGRLRERHSPETHIIPLALFAAARSGPPLQVYGTDYETPDGSCIRDYIHVSDLVQGHLDALHYLDREGGPITVNLGSGRGASVFEILATVEEVTGLTVPATFAARRPGDPPILVAETAYARQLIGFKPQRSDLSTIIADAARSFGMEATHALSA